MSTLNRIIRNVVFECIDAVEENENQVKRLSREIEQYQQKMDEYIGIINQQKKRIESLLLKVPPVISNEGSKFV